MNEHNVDQDPASAPFALADELAAHGLAAAFGSDNNSERLQAALSAGTHPRPEYLEVLIAQCSREPDFYVRDMLTWALTRLPRDAVRDRVLVELESPVPQARSQALHTLSKLKDHSVWPELALDFLHDPDEETARAAWRTTVALAHVEAHSLLVRELILELGRGDRETQKSLSRALVEIADAAEPALLLLVAEQRASSPAIEGEASVSHREERTRRVAHAEATLRLIEDPDSSFTL